MLDKDRSVVCNTLHLELREFLTNITPCVPFHFLFKFQVACGLFGADALVELTFRINSRPFAPFLFVFYLATIPFLNFDPLANLKKVVMAYAAQTTHLFNKIEPKYLLRLC